MKRNFWTEDHNSMQTMIKLKLIKNCVSDSQKGQEKNGTIDNANICDKEETKIL